MADQLPRKTTKGSASVRERLKSLNVTEPFAVLATRGPDVPYVSLVAYAVTSDLKRIFFCTPKKTTKYRNILGFRQVSLLIDTRSGGKSLMETEAITVLGFARPLRKGVNRNKAVEIFLKKQPGFQEFLEAPTTALISIEIIRCIHVDKFQEISIWEPGKEKL